MSKYTGRHLKLLTPDSVSRAEIAHYLLAELVDRNCQRMWNEILNWDNGLFNGRAPRALIRQMSKDYKTYCKSAVQQCLSRQDQEDVRVLFGALVTELGTTYAKAYEYIVARNRHLDYNEQVRLARIKARELEPIYEDKLLDILEPGRHRQDLASCYVPAGYAHWLPDVNRGQVLIRRIDTPTRDRRNLAVRDLRLSFEISRRNVGAVFEKYGTFDKLVDELLVPSIEHAMRACAAQIPMSTFMGMPEVCLVPAERELPAVLGKENVQHWRLTTDQLYAVSFALAAA